MSLGMIMELMTQIKTMKWLTNQNLLEVSIRILGKLKFEFKI